MNRLLKTGIVAAGLAMASSLALAAPEASSSRRVEDSGAHHYIYYPAKHIYFSPETQMWFWPEDGSWTSGGALPVLYQQYAHDGYNVYLDVERPYEAQQAVTSGYRHHRWTPYHYGDDTGDRHSRHGGTGE